MEVWSGARLWMTSSAMAFFPPHGMVIHRFIPISVKAFRGEGRVGILEVFDTALGEEAVSTEGGGGSG